MGSCPGTDIDPAFLYCKTTIFHFLHIYSRLSHRGKSPLLEIQTTDKRFPHLFDYFFGSIFSLFPQKRPQEHLPKREERYWV